MTPPDHGTSVGERLVGAFFDQPILGLFVLVLLVLAVAFLVTGVVVLV